MKVTQKTVLIVIVALGSSCNSADKESQATDSFADVPHSGADSKALDAVSNSEVVDTVAHDTVDDVTAPSQDTSESVDDTLVQDSVSPDSADCKCSANTHCNADGECIADVCLKGATTCGSLQQIQICSEDGSDYELVTCDTDTVCYLGKCVKKVCSPDDPPLCANSNLSVCNSLGTEYTEVPCPGGTGCVSGECLPIQPNVILLMDTSGSMNWINSEGDTPEKCEGENCPPWSWPEQCDDPESPKTRLGMAKKALQSVIASEAGSAVRMALQRFPQTFNILGAGNPTCNTGMLKGLTLWSGHNQQKHTVDIEVLQSDNLKQIMPAPFSADGKTTLSDWIDFSETYTIGDDKCVDKNGNPISLPLTCPGEGGEKICIENQCALLSNPELRANGSTPIGRALFYAGEIYRHLVVVEGKDCKETVDCGSPHYTCINGICHDPFHECRPNLVVLFTDGGETTDTASDKFFHPRIQAKRLRYGLGCANDNDCLSGAVCSNGICAIPKEQVPKGNFQVLADDLCHKGSVVADEKCKLSPNPGEVCCQLQGFCHQTNVPCANNLVCFDYKYKKPGGIAVFSGFCEVSGLEFTDAKGANVLRTPKGDPFSVQVHVVNASKSITGNSLIAAYGGGKYVPVDFGDVEKIVDVFLPLFDIKADLSGCGSQ